MLSVCNVMQIMQGSFKYFQVQTHVQTARESPDLNMDFRSFDNGCKQLYEKTSMQEYRDQTCFFMH